MNRHRSRSYAGRLLSLVGIGLYSRQRNVVVPVADFISDNQDVVADIELVTFTDLSTNNPSMWLWEKNSGSGWVSFETTPTQQNPLERFSEGVWSIRLTASNTAGSNTHTINNYITATVTP